MKNYAFKTKEEYLQYRKDWKAEYKELSESIRELKWLTKQSRRNYSKALKEMKRPSENYYSELYKLTKSYQDEKYKELIKKHFPGKEYHFIDGMLTSYKGLATSMLEELKMAKEKAQDQYQKTKNLTFA